MPPPLLLWGRGVVVGNGRKVALGPTLKLLQRRLPSDAERHLIGRVVLCVKFKKGFPDVDPLRLGVCLEGLLVPRGELVERVLWIAALLFELRV